MDKLLHFQAKFEAFGNAKAADPASGVDKEGVAVKGYASTGDKDRQNDIVDPSAFDESISTTYKDNPVVLFQHKMDMPIGRVTEMKVDAKGLYVEAVIFDAKAADLIRQKVLRTFSIGYVPKTVEYRDKDDNVLDPKNGDDLERIWWEEGIKRIVKKLELFEISVVSIPANAGALFSLAKSLDTYFEEEKAKYLINSKDMKKKEETPEVVENKPGENPEGVDATTPAEEVTPEPGTVEPTPETDETPVEEEATKPEAEEVEEAPEEVAPEAEEVEGEETEEKPVEPVEETPAEPEVAETEPEAEPAEGEEKAVDPYAEIAKRPELVKLALDSCDSLQKKVAELEAKLDKIPAKQAKIYQHGHGKKTNEVETPKTPENEPSSLKVDGFKAALKGAVN